jgi:hypothetical protein
MGSWAIDLSDCQYLSSAKLNTCIHRHWICGIICVERRYVEYAGRRYSSLGTFNRSEYNRQELEKYDPFDFVMMNGLLHHLDDATALELLKLANASSKPGGKVLCIDGGLHSKQNVFAEAYEKLVVEVFGKANVKIDLREDLFYIPYSLVIMILEKPG